MVTAIPSSFCSQKSNWRLHIQAAEQHITAEISIGMLAVYFIAFFLLAGCSSYSVTVMQAQEVKNYDELIDMAGSVECNQVEAFKECLYYDKSFNIFTLVNREQQFSFKFDGNGQIVGRKLSETSTEYHLFPHFQLPEGFEEFK
jgi:hypothetical protein